MTATKEHNSIEGRSEIQAQRNLGDFVTTLVLKASRFWASKWKNHRLRCENRPPLLEQKSTPTLCICTQTNCLLRDKLMRIPLYSAQIVFVRVTTIKTCCGRHDLTLLSSYRNKRSEPIWMPPRIGSVCIKKKEHNMSNVSRHNAVHRLCWTCHVKADSVKLLLGALRSAPVVPR